MATDILASSAMARTTSKLFLVSVTDSSLSNFPQPAKFNLGSYGLNDSIKKSQGSCQDFKTRHLDLSMPNNTDASLWKIPPSLSLSLGAEVTVEIIMSYKNKE